MSIRKSNYLVLVELIFLLLFLFGCTIAPSLSNNGLLFLDDFSHTGKGWDIWEKEDGSTINYYEMGWSSLLILQIMIMSQPHGVNSRMCVWRQWLKG